MKRRWSGKTVTLLSLLLLTPCLTTLFLQYAEGDDNDDDDDAEDEDDYVRILGMRSDSGRMFVRIRTTTSVTKYIRQK